MVQILLDAYCNCDVMTFTGNEFAAKNTARMKVTRAATPVAKREEPVIGRMLVNINQRPFRRISISIARYPTGDTARSPRFGRLPAVVIIQRVRNNGSQLRQSQRLT